MIKTIILVVNKLGKELKQESNFKILCNTLFKPLLHIKNKQKYCKTQNTYLFMFKNKSI